jgi:tetratricopeptide (TPR) repeat protein
MKLATFWWNRSDRTSSQGATVTDGGNLRLPFAGLLILIAALVAQNGCGPAEGSSTRITNRTDTNASQYSADLFGFAIENLNHLEDSDCEDMVQKTELRLRALQESGVASPDALLASWPEPDMLRQVVSRLNQWVDTQSKPAPQTRDPMLAQLPADLARLPMLANLDDAHFNAYDEYMLMEAVWLRDAARSKWASGSSKDELQVARNLFDWTVRNIQTGYDNPNRLPQLPWETLFLGHGTSWERAWTYILMLRQRGIDAAVLALPAAALSPAARPPNQALLWRQGKESLLPWCVGVLIGEKKKRLYLFDPLLCLPVPGPHGVVDKSGRLDVVPAALDEVMEDPRLLDRFSIGANSSYWARKADLNKVVALVDASPIYLAPRAKRVASNLTGDNRLVLDAEPSQQRERFKAAGMDQDHVRLWELPYRTLQRRLGSSFQAVENCLAMYLQFIIRPDLQTVSHSAPLYKGRILHLKGRYFDDREAVAYYQRARPRYKLIDDIAPQFFKQHAEAYSKWKKPNGQPLAPNEVNGRATRDTLQFTASLRDGKHDASYWLGLIQYDSGQYRAALEYLVKRTPQAGPQAFWTSGVRYNTARCYEAIGQLQTAIDLYEASVLVPDDRGNIVPLHDPGSLVRARWLKELVSGTVEKAEEKKAPGGKAPTPVEKKIGAKHAGEEKPADKKPEEGKVFVKAADEEK